MSNTDSSRVVPGDIPAVAASTVGSLARAGLAALGAILVKDGLLTSSQEQSFVTGGVGIALFVATAAWAWFKNRKARTLVVSALNSPAPRVPAK